MSIAADYLSERDLPIMRDLLVPILIAVCGEKLSVLSLVAVQAVNGLRLTTNQSILKHIKLGKKSRKDIKPFTMK